jgi:aminopeptidase N
MSQEKPRTIYRADYRPADYRIDTVDLRFDLTRDATLVAARLGVRRNEGLVGDTPPLVLDGESLELCSVAIDGHALPQSAYHVTAESLVVEHPPARFELETLVRIHPEQNTKLSGLYASGGMYCTQCEAHGFRRITYFIDRPDVMARYRVRIEADRERFPVLLSNGNRVAEEALGGGRHAVTWEDPFPKPSYLFALVAGDLRCHAGAFTTRSSRDVRLEIWVEPRNLDRCEHALRSLQKAMRWEEERFGLEYDLDLYMIVAVNDFNMGAMENKGLNIFNAKYVLALPETATDDEYQAIEGVIAHEYFHNWTGNRVTCRDWFQLTLKEGLTVFRDQEFTSDTTSRAAKRIADVKALRALQFPEDAGPMAHPIRPESYIAMDNFYTATVYEKGAEVVRLYDTLLGADGFRRGMDLYFERHDGQAVTCDDFRAAMADANGVDLERFERWYAQAGTPSVEAHGSYSAEAHRYTLTLRQTLPHAEQEPPPAPLPIPVALGLLGPDGSDLPLVLEGETSQGPTTRVLLLEESEQSFAFTGIGAPPVPSLLRGFSAPVRLCAAREPSELAFLMARDSDPFNRWDAGQQLAQRLLLELAGDAAAGRALALDPLFVEAFGRLLVDPELDGSLRALALALPSERLLGQEMEVIDVEALHAARQFGIRELARRHRAALEEVYERCTPEEPYRVDRASIDRRRLGSAVLGYLAALGEPEWTERIARQFERADNMTQRQAALALLVDLPGPERDAALSRFYEARRGDPLMLDKWFNVQALCVLPDTCDRVEALSRHPDFTFGNPNRVRALVGAFAAGNQVRFHGADGRGYRFLADAVLELDAINPQVAARLVGSFNQWRRFDAGRRALMQAQLERIAERAGLSKDVYEIVGRALGR